MTRLSIRLLGTFQATLEEEALRAFDSDKTRALLAYLAVESDQAQRREKLAGLLWPETPEGRARASLSQALYNLRTIIRDHQATPPFLFIRRDTIQFNQVSDHWLDVSAFEALLGEVASHDHRSLEACDACVGALQEAVSLFRGEFLVGLYVEGVQAFQEWCLLRRERLQNQAIAALQKLAVAYEARGKIDQALEVARGHLELDPYSEDVQGRLMRLLDSSGQRAAALAQYESHRRTLMEELDVEPDPETTALYERIRTAQADPDRSEARRHNLPEPLTAFIGRQAEVKALQERLADPGCRLLTVLGPGGSGKTRLALEAARAQLENFAHGVYLVALNPLQTPESIPPGVAEALELLAQEEGNLQEQLLNYLRLKNVLLVMDGFEHLLDGAGFVTDILRAAPGVKILVTSRARLNLKGEHLFTLSGLDYPPKDERVASASEYAAVQLFQDGARRIRSDFHPQGADLASIVQVCRAVQGMPLAILLASAWITTLEPVEIANEVERGLEFLTADWTDIPDRQHSLRATFDYSWNLLSGRERTLFASLSTFRGGFIRRAAREVCGATPNDLRALVDKSMLQNPTPGRYEIHDLLRQYGAEKLAQAPDGGFETHDRYCAYYCQALERWGREIKSPHQVPALAAMDGEHENLRAAWNWAARQADGSRLERMLEALCLYYGLRVRYPEGESACHLATEKLRECDLSAEGARTRALLLTWESHFNRNLGRHERARTLLEEAQALAQQARVSGQETRRERAFYELELGNFSFSSDRKVAMRHFQRSLEAFEELVDSWWIATLNSRLAQQSLIIGDSEVALEFLDKCLPFLRRLGDPISLARALNRRSILHVRLGELDQGLEVMQECAAISRSIGDRASLGQSLMDLGLAYGWNGRFSQAIELFSQSLPIYQELGNLFGVAFNNLVLGMAKTLVGKYDQAEGYLQTSLALAQEYGFQREIAASFLAFGWLALREPDFQGAKDFFTKSVATYRQVGDIDELGWALAGLGYAHHALGETQEGLIHLCETLKIGVEARAQLSLNFVLVAAAVILGENGDSGGALELYSLARQNPVVANSQWFEDVFGRKMAAFAESLPPEAAVAARERGWKRDLWETAAELLQEFCAAESNVI